MRIVITSGPSYEPIDQVRRLTNSSTGELGTLMAESFAEAGHSVVCFRAVASTFAAPLWPVEVIPFATNQDLVEGLARLPAREEVNVVLHAAALCDFKVGEIVDEEGVVLSGSKISSRSGKLRLTLEPAPKVISALRRMFPASIIVGWKFELEGAPADVLAKGKRQIDECLTDACVLNGNAYGAGFGVISRAGELIHLPDKPALCRFLLDWIERMPALASPPRDPSFHALSSFTSLSPFI
jgi:phosphopantothenoylcysteine synthetase/decarboxylase